ncbi:MAG: hypothetical protein HY293_05885 [Planctomycetes bacterium]|nr:hypothetical protein [Planctomycetota bacterium]
MPHSEGKPPRDEELRIYLPGGVPVLRAAVEELLKSDWNEVFQCRALEISAAFEGSFRGSGDEDLAGIARSIRLLVELEPREVAAAGRSLEDKLNELLERLETLLKSDGEVRTG